MKSHLKRRSLVATVAAAALAATLAIAPVTAASAAGSKSWNYSCGSWNFLMQSNGTNTVGHYRNGALIVSWYNSVSTWRSSTFTGGGAATGSIYASYALYGSSANCVLPA